MKTVMCAAFMGMLVAGAAYAGDDAMKDKGKGQACQETGDGNVNCAAPGASIACQTINGKTTCSSDDGSGGIRSQQSVRTGGNPEDRGVRTRHGGSGKSVTVVRPDGSVVKIDRGKVTKQDSDPGDD